MSSLKQKFIEFRGNPGLKPYIEAVIQGNKLNKIPLINAGDDLVEEKQVNIIAKYFQDKYSSGKYMTSDEDISKAQDEIISIENWDAYLDQNPQLKGQLAATGYPYNNNIHIVNNNNNNNNYNNNNSSAAKGGRKSKKLKKSKKSKKSRRSKKSRKPK